MKIERLETHDRFQHFMQEQAKVVNEGCDECLKRNFDSLFIQDRCPYVYIFAFGKINEKGNMVLHWQPRMEKPEAQSNSILIRVKSHTDILNICWNIPREEFWNEYKKGNVAECYLCLWSINQFLTNKKNLEAPHQGDLPKSRVNEILLDLARVHEERARMQKMYAKPDSSEPFQALI